MSDLCKMWKGFKVSANLYFGVFVCSFKNFKAKLIISNWYGPKLVGTILYILQEPSIGCITYKTFDTAQFLLNTHIQHMMLL